MDKKYVIGHTVNDTIVTLYGDMLATLTWWAFCNMYICQVTVLYTWNLYIIIMSISYI